MKSIGLDEKKIISQCYDGTSVMSGNEAGVRTRIEKANTIRSLLHPSSSFGNDLFQLSCANGQKKLRRIAIALQCFSRFKVKQLSEGIVILLNINIASVNREILGTMD